MKKEEAKELLKRYRLGQCTKKEIEMINHWYNSLDENGKDTLNAGDVKDLKHQIFKKIEDRIEGIESKSKLSRGKVFPSTQYYWLGAAAVFLIGIFYGVFSVFQSTNKIIEDMVVLENTTVKEDEELLPSTIYLSDGSVVKLKGDSKLEYPIVFTGLTREVKLIGEAFFEVAKDNEKPFIIHAGNLTTKVLGTSFNIKAYENDESSEVEVITGKVAVMLNEINDQAGKELVLVKNQKAVYTKNSNSLVQAKSQTARNFNSLNKSKLIFNETSLEDIVKVLNAYYSVQITFQDDKLKSCLITAELTDEPLEISLKILTRAIGAEYEINDKDVKLSGRGCGFNDLGNK